MQRPPWAACSYCHGERGDIDSAHVPAIAGQSGDYIIKQLADFRAGRRQSPLGEMRSATMLLDAADDATVAAYFSAMPPRRRAPTLPDDGSAGARLFWYGGDDRVACASCHGGSLSSQYPVLFGLNPGYLARQLRAFRDGSRGNDPDASMQLQAAKLSDVQIEAVARYLGAGESVD